MAKKDFRPVDRVLDEYSQSHSNPTNRLIQYISIPLLVFGFLGLVWWLPFPYLVILGKYNGFVNWGSFIIAFSIYYYYRLSPMLSYGALLLVFALSAGIVSLEKLQKQGFAELWQVCLVIFGVAILLQSIGHSVEGKFPSISNRFKNLLVAPLWLISEIFKKIGIKV